MNSDQFNTSIDRPSSGIIQKMDRTYRKKILRIYVIVLMCIVTVLYFGFPPLTRWLGVLSIPDRFLFLETVSIIFLLSFIIPALFLIRTGKKIIGEKIFPYEGMKVIRDTRILRGNQAVRQGKILLYFGIVAIAMAIIGSFSTHYYFVRFKTDPMFKGIFYKASSETGKISI